MARAKEMILLGEWFSAHKALELGLCNAVVEPEELLPRALEVAEKLAKVDPFVVSKIKQLMNAELRSKLDRVISRESRFEQEMMQRQVRIRKALAKL